MKIIPGRTIASDILQELKHHIDPSDPPGLGVVLIGTDPASQLYVRRKLRACREAGIAVELVKLSESVSEQHVLDAIRKFNSAKRIHGILVQLPLPKHLSTDRIIHAIDPHKDADGFHPAQRSSQVTVVPVLTQAVAECLKYAHQSIEGKTAVIIARVGSPMVSELRSWLVKRHAKTRIATAVDKAVPYLPTSDIVIIGLGGLKNARILKGSMLKDGTTVIDIGIIRDPNNPKKIDGNVDAESMKHLDGFITPVPGGVGPLTIAFLLKNVVKLQQQSQSA